MFSTLNHPFPIPTLYLFFSKKYFLFFFAETFFSQISDDWKYCRYRYIISQIQIICHYFPCKIFIFVGFNFKNTEFVMKFAKFKPLVKFRPSTTFLVKASPVDLLFLHTCKQYFHFVFYHFQPTLSYPKEY